MFLGKWTITQGATRVVVHPSTGALGVAAPPLDRSDRLNAYGTSAAFTLQSALDGRFVARTGQTYAATATPDAAQYFTLRAADQGGGSLVVDLGTTPGGPPTAVWNVVAGAVVPGDVAGPPPTTVFTRDVVTVGLATILAEGITHEPDLTWVDLHGTDLSGAGGIIDLTKSVLDHADLSATTFPRGTGFQAASAVGLDLRNTTIPHGLLGQMNLRSAHLDQAVLVGVDLSRTDLTGASLRGANLADSNNLAYALFEKADLTGASLRDAGNILDTSFTGACLAGVDFTGSSVTGRMDISGADLSGATLANPADRVTIYPDTLVINSTTRFPRAVIRYLDLRGYDLSGINFAGADLTGCLLDQTTLNGANLGYAILDGASITGGVGMHGTNLSSASLRRADLTGAQLGAIGQLFRVGSDQPGYAAFLTALRHGDPAGVAAAFQANKHPLNPPIAVQSSTFTPDIAWTVQSGGAAGQFRVLLEEAASMPTLGVYQPTSPAVLSNAFMVDVNLKGANLYGVRASGAQLYATAGNSVNLNRAKVDGLQANNANLGHIDLSQANLAGVNFDYAVLTGADFTGATIGLDGSGGQPSFNGANLQGASFASARLRDVILANAAVAVANPTDPASAAGVWLFSLPAQQAQLVTPELSAATKSFTLPAALIGTMGQTGPVPKGVAVAFAKAGITLSSQALLAVLTSDLYWQVSDPADPPATWAVFRTVDTEYRPALGVAAGTAYTVSASFYLPLSVQGSLGNGPVKEKVAQAFADAGHPLTPRASATTSLFHDAWQVIDGDVTYTLWLTFTSSVRGVDTKITARPSIATSVSVFGAAGLPLSQQGTVTPIRTGGWRIDNDAQDPFNAARGYIELTALPTPDGGLDVYGSMIRIVRSSGPGQQEYVNVPCQTTLLPQAVLAADDNTICPNGASVAANTSAALPFQQWSWARFLTSPPLCIPDPQGQFFCPT